MQELRTQKIILCSLIAIYCLLFTVPVMAQIKLETGLPGHSTVPTETALPSYIKYLFIFGLSTITILALTQMIIGGISYILAAGNVAKVEDAKDTILQALIGIGVLLVSYLLLRTINPDLVNLRNPNLTIKTFTSSPSEDAVFREDLNKCLVNKISSECDKLKQSRCKSAVTDQADPCYCIQNPTAGICHTNMF